MELEQVKRLLNDYGMRPSKGKGQNFLINEDVLDEIVKAADLSKDDYVLEIGPGFGVLTQRLIEQVKKLLIVELDERLAIFLKKKFKGVKNLQLIESDILKLKNQEIVDLLGSQKYKIVANLPYAITGATLRKFLTYEPKPQSMVLLLQKEVGQKIVDKKNSLLSLSVKLYGQPKIVTMVGPENFYPQPKVESIVLKVDFYKDYNPALKKVLSQEELKNFSEKKWWQLLKIAFSSRRKQLHNNLTAGYKLPTDEVKKMLQKAGLEPNIRAEAVLLDSWLKLYQQFVVLGS